MSYTLDEKDLEIIELKDIQPSKAQQIKECFIPMTEKLAELEVKHESIISRSGDNIDESLMAEAKNLRLETAKIRIDAEKVRKFQKKEYLLAGKAIDGMNNVLKWAIQDKEDSLKEIENHFINIEQKRLDNLQSERVALLVGLVDDDTDRNYSFMEEDVWEAFLTTKKRDKQLLIDAENRAVKEYAEKKENERKEKEKLEAENKRLAEEKAESDKLIKAANDEKEEIRKELEEKEELERKAIADEKEKKQSELSKGDNEKVIDLINDLSNLKTKYIFESDKNKKMYSSFGNMIDRIVEQMKKDN